MDEAEILHGYQPTDVCCPYCGHSHGMLERLADGRYRYTCWCGARRYEEVWPA